MIFRSSSAQPFREELRMWIETCPRPRAAPKPLRPSFGPLSLDRPAGGVIHNKPYLHICITAKALAGGLVHEMVPFTERAVLDMFPLRPA